MAFLKDTPPAARGYQRYPLNMHKGEHPSIVSRRVDSAEEEEAAAKDGFDTQPRVIPEPPEPKPPMSLEERIDELEERIAALEARRGPGRPKKEEA